MEWTPDSVFISDRGSEPKHIWKGRLDVWSRMMVLRRVCSGCASPFCSIKARQIRSHFSQLLKNSSATFNDVRAAIDGLLCWMIEYIRCRLDWTNKDSVRHVTMTSQATCLNGFVQYITFPTKLFPINKRCRGEYRKRGNWVWFVTLFGLHSIMYPENETHPPEKCRD